MPLGRSLSASVGITQFDLSGTGAAPIAALRLALPVGSLIVLEPGFSVSRPEQQFGSTTTLLIPELAIQLQVPRRVAPYVGLGVGVAADFRPESAGGGRYGPSVSGAVGVRAAVSPHAGLLSELRVRGIGTSFGSSTAEWTIGGMWRI